MHRQLIEHGLAQQGLTQIGDGNNADALSTNLDITHQGAVDLVPGQRAAHRGHIERDFNVKRRLQAGTEKWQQQQRGRLVLLTFGLDLPRIQRRQKQRWQALAFHSKQGLPPSSDPLAASRGICTWVRRALQRSKPSACLGYWVPVA